MKFSKRNENILQKLVLLVVLMAVPVFAWGQKKTNSSPPAPKPSAPASHASAPHTNTPSHASTPSHGTTPSHGATNATHGTASTAHGATNATHGATNAGHGATTAGKAGTGTAGKTGTGTAGKTGTGKPAAAVTGKSGTTGRPGGATVSKAAASHTPPGKTVSLKGGGTASIRPNGQIRSINRNGMQIQHGLHGGRTVVSTHNGAKVVTTGKHAGYVQRAYVTRNGRTYVSRTTVVNNVAYTGVYRSYGYGGYCCYYGYSPAFYYGPAYYGWAYNPWVAPVAWGWGWGGAPWYGFYGGYFAPYPVYPSAAFWLTDYLISANLQAAYAARAEANAQAAANSNSGGGSDDQGASNGGGGGGAAPAASGQVALSPEVKQAIAEEVKAQIAAEQAAAKGGSSGAQQASASSGEVPPALDPARRTFVVDVDLAVVADGQECALTQGDVITRISDTPDQDRKVTASVASSKKNDCAPGKQVLVAVDDLQEMHNHFQQQIDDGLKTLASKQGSGGLPKAPDTSTTPSDVPPPPADTTAAKTLEDQQKAADQTEADVKKETASSAGGQH